MTRLMARVYSRIQGAHPMRWAVGKLSPETRRFARQFLREPSQAPRAPRPSMSTIQHEGPLSSVSAADRRLFVPDGSGSDPRVNVIGHFRGAFGMGEAARSLVMAAQEGGVRVTLISAGTRDERGADLRLADAIGAQAPHPINVICVNANETEQLMDEIGSSVIAGHYNIGFWFWELARLPDAWQGAVDRVDEIWVASRFVGETMSRATSKPVRTVRLAVDATPSRTYLRSEFALPNDVFIFLFTFNFSSYVARKNPLATIAAFRRAFPSRDERVMLVLKSTNGDKARYRLRQLEDAIDGDDRIRVIDRSMPRDEVFGLESVADSYVSLHRSEGFGLGLAESMFLGKPVIGTAYSGNLEFMDVSNSLLVDYRLTAVGEREYPFPDDQVWAEPDQAQAADLMRRLVSDPTLGHELGARARAHMQQQFSAAAVGANVAERLSQILDGQP